MNMTNEQYLNLIEKHPEVTSNGFGIEYNENSGLTVEECWEIKRQELKNAHREFEYCCQAIAEFPHYISKHSAYHLKHCVEEWLRREYSKDVYIPQGVFMLAAIYMGYNVRRIARTINARIGNRVRRSGKLAVIRTDRWGHSLVAM